MNQDKTFLGTEPVGKLLLKLAIPTIVAQLVNMLYNIVDRIYIGHIPGEGSLALTGVGVCMPILMIISAFAALISSGGAPRASIHMGKGDMESAEKILGGCFSLQILLSAVLTAVLLLWHRDLLLMFGASENTIGYASAYMSVYAVGTVFVQLTLGMGAFITAQGFTKVSMMTVLIGAVSNIILDPIFIFGFDMGVRGAAFATIVSQAVSAVWVLSFLLPAGDSNNSMQRSGGALLVPSSTGTTPQSASYIEADVNQIPLTSFSILGQPTSKWMWAFCCDLIQRKPGTWEHPACHRP